MPNRFSIEKRGGYNTDEVDERIDELEAIIRSYKDKDTAIKNAILSAQVAADSIIRNAKNRSFEMKEGSVKRVQDIINSVSEQKKIVQEFQEEYTRQVSKYLHDINERDIAAITRKIEALEEYLTKFSENEFDAPASAQTIPPVSLEPVGLGAAGLGSAGLGPINTGEDFIFGQNSGGSSGSSFLDEKDDLLSSFGGGDSGSSLLDEKDGLNSIFNLD